MADLAAALRDFHLLRPLWLLALAPALCAAVVLYRRQAQGGNWRRVIAPELAPFLLDATPATASRHLPRWAFIAWALLCVALAGPAWHQLPQPVYQQQSALVILLDLSASMLAQDVKPDRITRTRLKLIDLLKQRGEGTTAIVAHAGDAHVVSPLTDDANTLIALLPALHPAIMPIPGSDAAAALAKGLELLANADTGDQAKGHVLLVTDGVGADRLDAMDDLLAKHPGVRVSVLGVGTAQGAPIPNPNGGGFIKNARGEIAVARFDGDALAAFAHRQRGVYAALSADDRDIEQLTVALGAGRAGATKATERTFDTWQDSGFWLVLPVLPLIVLGFRRNLFALLLLAPLLLAPPPARALDWDDLWLNRNQQGMRAFARGEHDRAQQLFEDEAWKAAAAYRGKSLAQAEAGFRRQHTADGLYNLGNTLARAGKLEQAIAAYDQALKLQPAMADATFNKKLLEDALARQRQNASQGSQPEARNNRQGDDQKTSDSSSQSASPQQSDAADQPGAEAPRPSPGQGGQSQDSPPPGGQPGEQAQPSPDEDAQDNDAQGRDAADQGAADQSAQDQSAQPKAAGQPDQAKQGSGRLATDADSLPDEHRQTLEQWLRRVPDDPSGLLRRKFEYESRRHALEHGDRDPSPPDAETW